MTQELIFRYSNPYYDDDEDDDPINVQPNQSQPFNTFTLNSSYIAIDGYVNALYLLFKNDISHSQHSDDYILPHGESINTLASVNINGIPINLTDFMDDMIDGIDPYVVVPYSVDLRSKGKSELLSDYIQYALTVEQFEDDMTQQIFWDDYANLYFVYIQYKNGEKGVFGFSQSTHLCDYINAFRLTLENIGIFNFTLQTFHGNTSYSCT